MVTGVVPSLDEEWPGNTSQKLSWEQEEDVGRWVGVTRGIASFWGL